MTNKAAQTRESTEQAERRKGRSHQGNVNATIFEYHGQNGTSAAGRRLQ